MSLLANLGVIAGLFIALPWLAVAFNTYCNAVNRLLRRRRSKK